MRNGFTLIELLAVIVIISVISIITVPATLSSIQNTRTASLKEIENNLKRATENYLVINNYYMPKEIGEDFKISVADLHTYSYIKKVTDYGSDCNGFVRVVKLDLHNIDFEPYINCLTGYKTNNLVGYYDLDNDLLDKTASNRNGTNTNVSFQTDGLNKVAYFNGTSQIAFNDIYNNSSLNKLFVGRSPSNIGNNNENSTYMAWFKASTLDLTARSIFDDGNLGEGTIRVFNNRILASWGGTNSISYNTTINTNQWYHVVMTHEYNTQTGQYILNLYVDGILRGTNSIAVSSADAFYGPDTPMRVGNNFIGFIDEIRLYEKVLSSDEVLTQYNLTRTGR